MKNIVLKNMAQMCITSAQDEQIIEKRTEC